MVPQAIFIVEIESLWVIQSRRTLRIKKLFDLNMLVQRSKKRRSTFLLKIWSIPFRCFFQ